MTNKYINKQINEASISVITLDHMCYNISTDTVETAFIAMPKRLQIVC